MSIICGLLLTVSTSCLIAPSDKILDLENTSFLKRLYFMFMMMSILSYYLAIMLNTILLVSLNGVGRDSDKIRIFLKFDFIPVITNIFFQFGYFFLMWGISCSLYLFAGSHICIVFATLTTVIGGFVPIILNTIFMSVGHVIMHWYRTDPEDFKRKLMFKVNELQKEHLSKIISNSDIESSKIN